MLFLIKKKCHTFYSFLKDYSNEIQQKFSAQMEFEISYSIQVSTSQPSLEVQGDAVVSPPLVPPQYSIAKDRPKRDIRPP